jgi:hypothetical protein
MPGEVDFPTLVAAVSRPASPSRHISALSSQQCDDNRVFECSNRWIAGSRKRDTTAMFESLVIVAARSLAPEMAEGIVLFLSHGSISAARIFNRCNRVRRTASQEKSGRFVPFGTPSGGIQAPTFRGAQLTPFGGVRGPHEHTVAPSPSSRLSFASCASAIRRWRRSSMCWRSHFARSSVKPEQDASHRVGWS